jgi:hypothetical protein
MPVLATLLLVLAPIPCAEAFQDPVRSPALQAEPDEIAEHEELAVRLLNAVNGKDAKVFADLLDPEALVERAVAGLGLDSAFQKGWRWGATNGLRIAWAGDLPKLSDESKLALAFVRVRGTPKARSLLFRLRMTPGSRFDYLELWTGRAADGRLRVVDWVTHVDGARKSEQIRFGLLTSTWELKRPDPEHLAGVDREYFDHSELVRRLTAPVRKEAWQETLGLFETLPPELRREPVLLLTEMRIAAWLGDAARVLACYDGLTAHHPDYLTADLWAFAHDLWGEDEERALASLHRLRDCIGGDSQLDYLECEWLMKRGELPAAKTFADKARASEPDWLPPYWADVSIGLLRHDSAAVLKALIELDEHFTVEWKDCSEQDDYKEFVASPQYAEWLRHIAGKK